MIVGVDVSAVLEQAEDARHSLLSEVPRLMRQAVRRAAARERAEHGYHNRTGRLERSTRAEDVARTQVDLVADTEYAAYVNARGLMVIDQVAEEAAAALALVFEGEAKRLGRR